MKNLDHLKIVDVTVSVKRNFENPYAPRDYQRVEVRALTLDNRYQETIGWCLRWVQPKEILSIREINVSSEYLKILLDSESIKFQKLKVKYHSLDVL